MKKQLNVLLAIMLMVLSTSVFAAAKNENKELYLVEIEIDLPVGKFEDEKVSYTRKPIEIRGYLELTSSFLYSGGQKAPYTPDDTPKSVTAKFYWMTPETIRRRADTATDVNYFNRNATRTAFGRVSTRNMSYPTVATVTPTYSAIGETATAGGFGFQFIIARGNLRTFIINGKQGTLSIGEFGYGVPDMTFTLATKDITIENNKITAASGPVTAMSAGLLSSTIEFVHVFDGNQQTSRVNAEMRFFGNGKFKATRVPYFVGFTQELEAYFFEKYDYSDVEVLDRVVDPNWK